MSRILCGYSRQNKKVIEEYIDPFEKEQKEKERKIKKELGPLKW